MMEQLALDLFPKPKRDHIAEWRKWLVKTKGVNEEGLEVFDRLLATLGKTEAFERSKCLEETHGNRKVEGLTVEDLGLFTADDYHTCWDRSWAIKKGYTPEQVRDIEAWDYGKGEPIYAIPDGNTLL